jgi:phage tail sheath protein FI
VRYRPAGGNEETESFVGMRLTAEADPSSLVAGVNLRSRLVRLSAGSDYSATALATFPAALSGAWAALDDGDDALGSLVAGDFIGVNLGPGQRTGIQALEEVDQVAICMVPGMWDTDVRNALIVHCESLADRFAILDPPPGLSVQEIEAFRSPIDTKYAALYYPWVEIRDPRPGGSGLQAPPSGFMAGIYARTDVARGVHKAPANETIRSIRGLAQTITKREQDILNPQNINVLRAFPGRGNRVWGARVLTSDAAWKYVPVRRLFLMVEESIDEGTQWVVFEPNDEPLWARVRQTVSRFLDTQWRLGALQGATAEEAFFVACDRSTMTQDDIDNGRLICLVGIAPVKPAEFVIFRVQQKTLELSTN